MKIRRFLSLPVLFVFLVLGFVYYVTVFVFVDDWLGLQSFPGLLNLLIFSLLGSLCLFSFLVCILTNPGGVPAGYVPDVEQSHGANTGIERNGSNARRCDKCSVYKPPRAHHCRVCRRCVLKMDHHCIWISNCVGHRNYKSFLLLVFYGTISCAYSAVIIAMFSIQKVWDSSSSHHSKSFHICCGLLTTALSLLLGSLLVWHLYLTSKNMTTIEHHDGKRAAWLAKKSGHTYHHPYDVGAYKNITLVLGPNMLRWFWPTAIDHLKDGFSFPTARDYS